MTDNNTSSYIPVCLVGEGNFIGPLPKEGDKVCLICTRVYLTPDGLEAFDLAWQIFSKEEGI